MGPLPVAEVTSSSSQGMAPARGASTCASFFAVTRLPSVVDQLGPASWLPTSFPAASNSRASGALRDQAGAPSGDTLHR